MRRSPIDASAVLTLARRAARRLAPVLAPVLGAATGPARLADREAVPAGRVGDHPPAGGPPAHWVELVRDRAPDLLEPHDRPATPSWPIVPPLPPTLPMPTEDDRALPSHLSEPSWASPRGRPDDGSRLDPFPIRSIRPRSLIRSVRSALLPARRPAGTPSDTGSGEPGSSERPTGVPPGQPRESAASPPRSWPLSAAPTPTIRLIQPGPASAPPPIGGLCPQPAAEAASSPTTTAMATATGTTTGTATGTLPSPARATPRPASPAHRPADRPRAATIRPVGSARSIAGGAPFDAPERPGTSATRTGPSAEPKPGPADAPRSTLRPAQAPAPRTGPAGTPPVPVPTTIAATPTPAPTPAPAIDTARDRPWVPLPDPVPAAELAVGWVDRRHREREEA